ncbi:4a-hydroxytetrahydrobiopterin dehydratase [Mycobacterium hodleri]|uniref:4a-hydroxytetrahydrobiopterin dehydratase n=1 Tax=Mycolicibacterium hodleri TaxID=49897 RepID=A0A544VVT3_9MYCO|nr:VOC family protein [Mycolicibacterium hodleri]TQR84092.1 4a-hydroxytetrahydrobiopterin dehydratase [Mycolicibacterium hodleri]
MLTGQQISDVVDPLGWRLIQAELLAHVLVPSLAAAVDAASVAVDAAGAGGNGHLTAELQPDRVVLRLQTAVTGTVTDDDLLLARSVTEALAGRSLAATPGDRAAVPQAMEIAIDALDIALVRPFWQAATGYVDQPGVEGPDIALVDPLGRGPAIWFQQMDAPRPQRNRIHLDVEVAPELARPRIDAAIAVGGLLLSDAHAPAFWVLADAEGNEVCICTWQGRD